MSNNKQNSITIDEIIRESKTFEVNGDVLMRQIENEAILLHIPTGTYYNLSESSIPFWEALQNKQPLQPVIKQIINEYEVDRDRVLEDLQIFLEDLLQFGIVSELSNT